MTRSELDQVVHNVSNELLAKLGYPPEKGYLDKHNGTVHIPEDNDQDSVTCPDWSPPSEGISKLIDHTLLKPDTTEAEVIAACAEAHQHNFATLCVQPERVALVTHELQGSSVTTCAVIGFPLSATLTPIKCAEAEQVIKLGADEIDMVLSVGALKSRAEDSVYTDIFCVAELVHSAKKVLKVILETSVLDDREKVLACVLAKLAGADFVETSTGFGRIGATAHDVALMHHVVGGEMGIKAAGGISTYSDLVRMMRAGATRIGSSSSATIIAQAAAADVSSLGRS